MTRNSSFQETDSHLIKKSLKIVHYSICLMLINYQETVDDHAKRLIRKK